MSLATGADAPKASDPEVSELSTLVAILRHFTHWYLQPDIEEIAVNRPREVWLRLRRANSRGEVWIREADPKLTIEYLRTAVSAVANTYQLPFAPMEVPTVFATLPGGHRFTAISGPNCLYDEPIPGGNVALNIRQYDPQFTIDLKDWGLISGQPLAVAHDESEPNLPEDAVERLYYYMAKSRHLLISGATATGKTSMMNALIRRIDPQARIVTVQDTPELIVPQLNHVHILVSRTEQANRMTFKMVVDLLVRMTPDVILCGELSTSNAATAFELSRSGHGNMLTTIHASSIEAAHNAFFDRISHSLPNADREATLAEIKKHFKTIHIERHGALRRVTDIS